MLNGTWSCLFIAVVAGVINGSVLVPMKFMKKWPWENIWLPFSICAYCIAPWAVAFSTVSNLSAVYRSVPSDVLAGTFALGIGWGMAVTLFGIAVDMVGLSIGTALLYGSSVALGSLGALILLEPSKLVTPQNIRILLWDMILVVGVLVCAQAGRIREPAVSVDGIRARRGVVLSLIAGILSTLFNIVLVYGDPIRKQALTLGADPKFATNAIWSLAVTGGSLPSLTVLPL